MKKKQVTQKEFEIFISDYPNKLITTMVYFVTPCIKNFCDPSLGKYPENIVAQISMGKSYYGYFQTKEENDEYCIDEYFIWEK